VGVLQLPSRATILQCSHNGSIQGSPKGDEEVHRQGVIINTNRLLSMRDSLYANSFPRENEQTVP
jgi:hypothetical protein